MVPRAGSEFCALPHQAVCRSPAMGEVLPRPPAALAGALRHQDGGGGRAGGAGAALALLAPGAAGGKCLWSTVVVRSLQRAGLLQ